MEKLKGRLLYRIKAPWKKINLDYNMTCYYTYKGQSDPPGPSNRGSLFPLIESFVARILFTGLVARFYFSDGRTDVHHVWK